MTVGTKTNHREREEGKIIYPVYARRSQGLSIGINLFPDRKLCSFNCPYCEVFPFAQGGGFTIEAMTSGLAKAITDAKQNKIPIKDLCFSGNGEPTMSPHFTKALTTAARIRNEQAPESKLVLITNGTGLLNKDQFEFLKKASLEFDLDIWLKLDAATEAWYNAIDRSNVPHSSLISGIKEFAATGSPFTIQTIVCKINGALPPPEETKAWTELVTELALQSAGACKKGQALLRAVQIYGKCRPAPEDPLAEQAPGSLLHERAERLRIEFEKAKLNVPVRVYE